MEPTSAIPLLFALELVGVASCGAVLAWVLHNRLRALVVPFGLLIVAGILQTGRFVPGVVAGRAIAWAAAAAVVAALVGGRRVPDRRLWSGSLVVAGAGAILTAVAAPTTAAGLGRTQLAVHALEAAGFGALAVWAARRTQRSVRLRIIGAFLLVLFVVVVVAGSVIAAVTGSSLAEEELRRVGVQARAQELVISRDVREILSRSAAVAESFSTALAAGTDAGAVSVGVLERVFPDLGFVAFVNQNREIVASAGLRPEEAALGGSGVVTEALREHVVSSFERAPGEVVIVGAAPVYALGSIRSAGTVRGAALLGRRLDGAAMREIAERTGLGAALVSTSRGRAIASGGDALGDLRLPAHARERLAAGLGWRGTLRDGAIFAAAAPLTRPDATVPAALVLATGDTVLARTTLNVSRALFGGVLAAALVAIAIAVWFGSRFARPIVALTSTAQRVQQGDLSARTTTDGSDEVGALAQAFDRMTSSLQSTIATEHETRSRLETIVAGMAEGLISMDDGYRITSFNPAAEAATGIPAAEAIGRPCSEVFASLDDGGPSIVDALCPTVFDGATINVTIRARDGVRRTIAVTSGALRDADGNVVGVVDLLRDRTSEQQAEDLKTNVLSNISHELRTPLTSILGYARLLQRRDLRADQSQLSVNEILTAGRKLERTIDILVSVSAMQAGRLNADTVPMSPAHLLGEAVRRWGRLAPDRQVRAIAPASLPAVRADATLIGRAVDELVENALKFSPGGGIVTLRARRVEGGVEFSVADRGVGIAADKFEGLFEEFTQADASATRRFGGLGLGLTYVSRVLEAHGTAPDVVSKPGRGTRVSFVLEAVAGERPRPRAARRTQDRPAKPSTRPPRGRKTDTSRQRGRS